MIYDRKPEIPIEEIARQLDTWSDLAERSPEAVHLVPTISADAALSQSLDVVDDYLARRASSLGAFSAATACLGAPSVGGTHFTLVAARGRARWLIPRRVAPPGPIGARLYRAPDVPHQIAASGIEALSWMGLGGDRPAHIGHDARNRS